MFRARSSDILEALRWSGQVLIKQLEAVGQGQKVQIVMEGITIGRVTFLRICQLVAPSILAASTNLRGHSGIPAM